MTQFPNWISRWRMPRPCMYSNLANYPTKREARSVLQLEAKRDTYATGRLTTCIPIHNTLLRSIVLLLDLQNRECRLEPNRSNAR